MSVEEALATYNETIRFFGIMMEKCIFDEDYITEDEFGTESSIVFYIKKDATNEPLDDDNYVVDLYVYRWKRSGKIDYAFSMIDGIYLLDDKHIGSGFNDSYVLNLLNKLYTKL
jgi:hypothetical protein